jgi:hypothetical protein
MDFFIAAVVVVILAAIAIVAVHADDSSSTDVPISLSGKWHQTEGLDGISMYAEIVEGSIQIDMQSRDARYIYWLGTFESYKDTSRPFKVVSLGDSDALANSVFGSSEKTKKFSYKNGVISFEFSMFHGARKATVKLEKDQPRK